MDGFPVAFNPFDLILSCSRPDAVWLLMRTHRVGVTAGLEPPDEVGEGESCVCLAQLSRMWSHGATLAPADASLQAADVRLMCGMCYAGLANTTITVMVSGHVPQVSHRRRHGLYITERSSYQPRLLLVSRSALLSQCTLSYTIYVPSNFQSCTKRQIATCYIQAYK